MLRGAGAWGRELVRGCCPNPGETGSVHALSTCPGPHPGIFYVEEGLPYSCRGHREKAGHLDDDRMSGDIAEPPPGARLQGDSR